MAFQRTIVGALVKVIINGKTYNEVQSISYTIDYGEEPIYGVDSPFPQEIKASRISTTGSIQGIRVKNSYGLQGYNIRPQIFDALNAPYISIRIQDRSTGEDILFIPSAKVTNESLQAVAKGVVRVSFNFMGIQPQQTLDRI